MVCSFLAWHTNRFDISNLWIFKKKRAWYLFHTCLHAHSCMLRFILLAAASLCNVFLHLSFDVVATSHTQVANNAQITVGVKIETKYIISVFQLCISFKQNSQNLDFSFSTTAKWRLKHTNLYRKCRKDLYQVYYTQAQKIAGYAAKLLHAVGFRSNQGYSMEKSIDCYHSFRVRLMGFDACSVETKVASILSTNTVISTAGLLMPCHLLLIGIMHII